MLCRPTGTRYTDIFTFNDDGFFEENIRSQDLGCWKDDKDPNKVEVSSHYLLKQRIIRKLFQLLVILMDQMKLM